MTNRIDKTFARLKATRRKALIGYLTAGFPNKASLKPLVRRLSAAGLDLLELGIPFSDPIADGPTIQRSSQVALEQGATLTWILESVKALRTEGITIPIIFMSYCNPMYAMGVNQFFKRAAAAGVDGIIIPDMIPEEANLFNRQADAAGIHLIYLVAPTTPESRLRNVARKSRGFLYAVSLTGVTGTRVALPTDLGKFLGKVRSASRVPVAVGFGLSTPQQVKEASRYVDGVIVGSALIKAVEQSQKKQFKGAEAFVRSLANALNIKKEPAHAA